MMFSFFSSLSATSCRPSLSVPNTSVWAFISANTAFFASPSGSSSPLSSSKSCWPSVSTSSHNSKHPTDSATAFAATNFKKKYNAAAVLEWAVAFIFTFYVFSFFIDLLPAVHTKNYTSSQTEMQMEANDPAAQESSGKYYRNGRHGAATNGRESNGRESQRNLTNGEGVVNGVNYNGNANPGVHSNF
jgi:hypothetical protein